MTRAAIRLAAFTEAELRNPPTWMVLRQIEIESGFDNTVVSATGCVGICQINPKTAAHPGYGIAPCLDPLDVTLATRFLCAYLMAARELHGSFGKALLAYNVGMEGNLSTASKAYQELAAYVDVWRAR